MKCMFGGVWSGGGGFGLNFLFVVFFFFDWVLEVGIVKDVDVVEVEVRLLEFEVVVKKICILSIVELGEVFLNVVVDIWKFLCMDLMYQYLLMVIGFQVDVSMKMILVKKVKYRGLYVEIVWLLGSVIELVFLNKV